MSSLVIRNIRPSTKQALRETAARHGRSMEAEVRALLEERFSMFDEAEDPILEFNRACAQDGGVDLELPPRDSDSDHRVPDFTAW